MFPLVVLLQVAEPLGEGHYTAPPSCPRAADVELRFPSTLGSVRVEVRQEGTRFVGSAQAAHPQRPPFSRTIASSDCAELTDALILALEIEADAIKRDEAEAARNAAEGTVPGANPPRKGSSPSPARSTPEEDPSRLYVAANLGIGLVPALLPTVVSEFALFGEVGWASETSFFQPHFRFGGALSLESSRTVSGLTSVFSTLRATVDACPFMFGTTQTVRISSCVRQELGSIRANGDGFSSAASTSSLLSATGAAVLMRVPLGGGATTAGTWAFGVDGGVLAPWFRDRYTIGAPPKEVHVLPTVYPELLLSVVVSSR